MLVVLLSEKDGLIIIGPLSAHTDRGFQIKVRARLDESFEFLGILEFSITVQEKGCMIDRGFVMVMKLFKILDEVVDTLRVKELENT